jgi:hypothetical protein
MVPQHISRGIGLENTDISFRVIETAFRTCDEIAVIGSLIYPATDVIEISAKDSGPESVSVLIGFYQIEVGIADPLRIASRNNKSAVTG